MAKFIQAFLLAFLVVAMVAPDCEASFFKHKFLYKHPHYVQKYHYAPVIHQPVYYKAVPVYYKAPKRKFYKKKFYKG